MITLERKYTVTTLFKEFKENKERKVTFVT